MKFAFYGVLVVFSFFLGKMMYGSLAPTLLGIGGSSSDEPTVIEVKVHSKMGTVTESIDLEAIDPKDFPEKVILSESLTLVDETGANPLTLDAGSPVTPLEINDLMLKVTSPLASHLTSEVHVSDTDFVNGVAKQRMENRIAALEKGQAEMAKDKPAEMAAKKEEMVEKEAVAKTEEPEEPEGKDLTPEELVAAMKAGLEAGALKELDIAKVETWEAMEKEFFDGDEFQVGVVNYKEVTILGEKTLQAKALFRKGKLVKWIHAKTGMQIR